MLNLKNTLDGYLKNVEVIGNTVQDTNNLADIRSVGDKVEGQELYKIDVVSCGKNLIDVDDINVNFNASHHQLGTCPESVLAKNIDISNLQGIYTISCQLIKFNGSQITPKIILHHTPISDTAHNGCYSHATKEGGVERNFGSVDITNYSYITITTGNITGLVLGTSYNLNVEGIQFEEGTRATSYEPFKGDKLEILSPVQLEKVGDVADRIICKDGVWGVEKNITKVNLKDLSFVVYSETNDMIVFNSNINIKQKGNFYGISNKLIYSSSAWNNSIIEDSVGLDSTSLRIFVKFRKSTLSTLEEFNKFKEDLFLLYQRDVCEFISLPHDQQVKLRTFAGQTNIAFLTEIPGQIKAQVPKSLGATVNTHTEQIADLHNSLERVKKLEETTVSTIETESSFTTVDATSNGYFEDVKLEGKTLVNLATQPKNNGSINNMYATISTTVCKLAPSTEYTYIISNNSEELVDLYLNNHNCFPWTRIKVSPKDITIGKATTLNEINGDIWISLGVPQTVAQNLAVILLEGDHTNNPPEYFEGLMSVGQDVEEVSVESVSSGNLANDVTYGGYYYNSPWGNGNNTISKAESNNAKTSSKIKVFPNATYFYNAVGGNRCVINFFKNKSDELPYSGVKLNNSNIPTGTFSTDSECNYIEVYAGTGVEISNLFINLGDKQVDKECQLNKKPLLYFNPTTETWEKPVLREWDTIEKHSDGKYYYHKRSKEVVLNGSEGTWGISGVNHDSKNILRFFVNIDAKPTSSNDTEGYIISDIFTTNTYNGMFDLNVEGIAITQDSKIGISILKSKLTTQDVAGFKAWLKASPVTVVYHSMQEEVYECTNIDLMTYSGETNYIINSGAIPPKSILKVHNNISNVVKILQEKVNLLENTFIAGLKSVLSGDMYSLATILYPEDFEQNDNTEQDIMVIPE